MVDVSKLGARAWTLLLTFLMTSAMLAVWIGQREGGLPTSAAPLVDWDIPRLTAYLNEKGVGTASGLNSEGRRDQLQSVPDNHGQGVGRLQPPVEELGVDRRVARHAVLRAERGWGRPGPSVG